jgi:hypothetical protein
MTRQTQILILALGITLVVYIAEALTMKDRRWDYAPHLDTPDAQARVVYRSGDFGLWNTEEVFYTPIMPNFPDVAQLPEPGEPILAN